MGDGPFYYNQATHGVDHEDNGRLARVRERDVPFIPSFIRSIISLADSAISNRPVLSDMKFALYPGISIRTWSTPGSSGSRFSGQNSDRPFFHDHSRRLALPVPCTMWRVIRRKLFVLSVDTSPV